MTAWHEEVKLFPVDQIAHIYILPRETHVQCVLVIWLTIGWRTMDTCLLSSNSLLWEVIWIASFGQFKNSSGTPTDSTTTDDSFWKTIQLTKCAGNTAELICMCLVFWEGLIRSAKGIQSTLSPPFLPPHPSLPASTVTKERVSKTWNGTPLHWKHINQILRNNESY